MTGRSPDPDGAKFVLAPRLAHSPSALFVDPPPCSVALVPDQGTRVKEPLASAASTVHLPVVGFAVRREMRYFAAWADAFTSEAVTTV